MRISDWSSDVCSSVLIEHQRSLVTRPCAGYNLCVQPRLRANNMSQNHCGNRPGFTVLASNRKNTPTRALRVIVDLPNESLLKLLKFERLSYSIYFWTVELFFYEGHYLPESVREHVCIPV